MQDTPFKPDTDGFHFRNAFVTQYYAGPIDIGLNGLCGGMSYSALDYYFAKLPIPSQKSLPPDGSVLEAYIYDRQLTALGDTIWQWVERFVNPFGWRTSEFFHWGLQATGGGQLELLKRSIDAGRPCPIGLTNPSDFMHNHFVVATGYELGSNDTDLKIYVYDCNYPDSGHKVLTADAAKYRYVEDTGEEWLTYFVALGYRSQVPNMANPCADHHIQYLTGHNLSGQLLSQKDFRCARCINTKFVGCTAIQTDFSNAVLTGASFYGATLRNSNFTDVKAGGAIFYGADCQSVTFAGAAVTNGNFIGADLHNANLGGATMDVADFYGADLSGADLSKGKFVSSSFYGADLRNAKLMNADFTGASFVAAKLDGADRSGAIGLP